MPDNKSLSTSITLEARIDIRAIATLALYFIREGTPLRSRSSVLRTSIEEFARRVVKDGATPIKGVAESYEFLRTHGFVQGSRKSNKDFFAEIQGDGTDDMEEQARKIQADIDVQTTKDTDHH